MKSYDDACIAAASTGGCVHRVGELAVMDTIRSGMVACRVVKIVAPGTFDNMGVTPVVIVEVTATGNRTYPRGMVVERSTSSIVPRGHYKQTRLSGYVLGGYSWKNEG